MSTDINETKRKQREAAEKARLTGLNREQRRALKKAGIVLKTNTSPQNIKKKLENKIRHPMPYRANLDSKHDESTVIEEYKPKTEAEKGWDQPAPKTAWKKPAPKQP